MAPTSAATAATQAQTNDLEREDKLFIGHLLRADEIDQILEAGGERFLAVAVLGFLAQHVGVERDDHVVEDPALGHAAVGMEPDDLAVLGVGRRHVREHPVVGARFGEVLDVGEDLAAVEDGVPQEPEHRARHVGVADQAVRRADQLRQRVAGHGAEHRIGVGDAAFDIGLGDDDVAAIEVHFDIGRLTSGGACARNVVGELRVRACSTRPVEWCERRMLRMP